LAVGLANLGLFRCPNGGVHPLGEVAVAGYVPDHARNMTVGAEAEILKQMVEAELCEVLRAILELEHEAGRKRVEVELIVNVLRRD
jgi:hypothetical protein